jgi:mannose-1-phosphate guanylyltransferase
MDAERLVVIIMAGGGGTRFWPRSRAARPKQFLSFDGGESLLARTVARLAGLVDPSRIFIITGEDHAALAREHSGLPDGQVVAEPMARDTAACIGVGAMLARTVDPDAVMGVLSADHLVSPVAEFQRVLRRAARLADSQRTLVTIGIRPDRPATGYGYIEMGARLDDEEPAAFHIVRFQEKPELEDARRFVLAGNYLWNSGMFAFRAEVILDAIEQHLPELAARLRAVEDPRRPEDLARAYPGFPRISIDHGVFEHAKNLMVVEGNFEWDDLGTFEAVARHAERHPDHCLSRGEAFFSDSRGVLVDNDLPGLVAVHGVSDLLVVRTGDAVLILPRRDAEKVKDLVRALKEQGWSRYM